MLLFSAFDSWMVDEHFKRKYDGSLLGASFGWMFFVHPVMGVVAGFTGTILQSIFNTDSLRSTSYDRVITPDERKGLKDKDISEILYWDRIAQCDFIVVVLVVCFCVVTFVWSSTKPAKEEGEKEALLDKTEEAEEAEGVD